MSHIVLVFVLLLVVQLASAGIYGIYPIASTVLVAGRINTVRWIDDGNAPRLKEMGRIKIDLYLVETYVSTLAESVDPKSLSADVWISPSLRHNGSDYHMRFICEKPPVTVYTADFTITGMASLSPINGPTIDDSNKSTPSIVYVSKSPNFTLTPPNTTSANLSSSTRSIEPSATAPSLMTLEDQGLRTPLRAQTGAGIAGLRKRPTVDLERLKFRFVFIFWPTLIGITMAL